MQIELHAESIPVSDRLRAYASRVLSAVLKPFARLVTGASARIAPRAHESGRPEFACIVHVPMRPEGTLVVEGSAHSPQGAIENAAGRLWEILRTEWRRATALPAFALR